MSADPRQRLLLRRASYRYGWTDADYLAEARAVVAAQRADDSSSSSSDEETRTDG